MPTKNDYIQKEQNTKIYYYQTKLNNYYNAINPTYEANLYKRHFIQTFESLKVVKSQKIKFRPKNKIEVVTPSGQKNMYVNSNSTSNPESKSKAQTPNINCEI